MRINFLLFCLVVLLTGCVNAPVVQSPAQLSPTHGYVYVNLPKGRPDDSLTLKSLKDGSQHTLLTRSDTKVNALGMWLPAGEYKLANWAGSDLEGYPSLTVQAGRLTDLGSLIPLQVGGYEFVVLPIRHAEFARDVGLAINEYQAFLVTKEPIEWRPEKTPKPVRNQAPATGLGLIADLLMDYERHVNKPSVNKQLREAASTQDFFRLAKMATPPLTDEPGHDVVGNLFYGADFGQIRIRKPTGEWDAIDTGTLHSVTAVEVYGALIVAGLDNGVIRISENAGRTWKDAASLGGNVLIVDIDRVGDYWVVMTARQITDTRGWKSVDQITVYTAKKDDFRDINRIKDIEVKTPNFLPPRGEAAKGFYYISSFPDLLRFDVASMEWKSVTPPTDVTGFHVSPSTGMIAAYRQMGAFSKLFVSADQGASWSKYDNPPYIIMDIRFENKTDGRAVRSSIGAFSGTVEFMQYDHLRDSWSKTAEAPQGCTRVLPDDNTPKFCITAGGSILKYSDQKWAAEFSVD